MNISSLVIMLLSCIVVVGGLTAFRSTANGVSQPASTAGNAAQALEQPGEVREPESTTDRHERVIGELRREMALRADEHATLKAFVQEWHTHSIEATKALYDRIDEESSEREGLEGRTAHGFRLLGGQ